MRNDIFCIQCGNQIEPDSSTGRIRAGRKYCGTYCKSEAYRSRHKAIASAFTEEDTEMEEVEPASRTILNLERPVFFPLFKMNQSVWETTKPEICKELNRIHSLQTTIADFLYLNGSWEHEAFIQFIEQEIEVIEGLKIWFSEYRNNTQSFSQRFIQFMAPYQTENLSVLDKIGKEMQKLLTKNKNSQHEIEIELPPFLSERYSQLSDKYTDIWQKYRKEYL